MNNSQERANSELYFNNKKILITGANGLIGRQLALDLQNQSAEIIQTSRSTSIPGFEHTYIASNLTDIAPFLMQLDELKPDVIFHTAAITSVDYAELHPQECISLNENAVKAIAKWCGNNSCRLIHFSTDFVFDGTKEYYEESDSTAPLSLYGKGKARSEVYVNQYAPDHIIVRPILVYGHVPYSPRLNFPQWVVTRLTEGTKTYITGDQFRAPVYVKDLSQAVVDLAATDFNGLVHIGGPEGLSIMDFAQLTAEEYELDASLLHEVNTGEISQAGRRPLRTVFTNELLKSFIDYQPLTPRQALRDMHDIGVLQ